MNNVCMMQPCINMEKYARMPCLICTIFFMAFFSRYLATCDSFATIACSYRVGIFTVCGLVREVASAIWTTLVEEVMPVPTREDWRTMAEHFEWYWNFPNTIGAIDGKHVVIQSPSRAPYILIIKAPSLIALLRATHVLKKSIFQLYLHLHIPAYTC